MNHSQIVEKYKEQISKIIGDNWDMQLNNYGCSFSEKFMTGKYSLEVGEEKKVAATFELIPMINCCGIVVSTRAEVTDEFRNKGLGTVLNSFRIDAARELGYGVLMCTDIISNTPQQAILKRNGWKMIHDFVNPRTKNRVGIHIINL